MGEPCLVVKAVGEELGNGEFATSLAGSHESPAVAGLSCEWRVPDLNWGHRDFQSRALPTELTRRGPGTLGARPG